MARPGLIRNRKFARLAADLEPHCACGGDIAAMGVLELLWSAAYESAGDYIGDGTDVENTAHWRGPRGVLLAALVRAGGPGSAGFVEELPDHPGHYRVHDLWDHAPDYVERRAKREAARLARGVTISQVRAEAARVRWELRKGSGVQLTANDSQVHSVTSSNNNNGMQVNNKCSANALQKSPLPLPHPLPDQDPPVVPQGGQTPGKTKPARKTSEPLPFKQAEALEAFKGCQRFAWPPKPEARDWGDLAQVIRIAETLEALARVVRWLGNHETHRDVLTIGIVRRNLGAWIAATAKPDAPGNGTRRRGPQPTKVITDTTGQLPYIEGDFVDPHED